MSEAGETGQRHSGPSFENALRSSLICGSLVADGQSGQATLSHEVMQILGIEAIQEHEVPVASLPEVLAAFVREVLASGKPASLRTIPLPPRVGSRFAHVTALPLNSAPGRSSVVVTIFALDPVGEFLRQIRQLDRLANTGTLAAGMAHEIKNALVAGRTFLDLLLEKNTDAELVQIVRREQGRIDALVGRMLRFAASSTTSVKALRLHEVLDHALRLVEPQAETRTIALERAFRASPDTARGDEYELQQAFVNLLLNALEAMSDRGKLTLSTESSTASDGSRVLRVIVSDTGAGILPEHMSRLFEPFFTTKDTGTGLGLSITRRIIEEHGGSIAATSRVGQGTSFTVLLPLQVETGGMQLGGFATGMLGKKI
jgi:signal transduction histidine kinase